MKVSTVDARQLLLPSAPGCDPGAEHGRSVRWRCRRLLRSGLFPQGATARNLWLLKWVSRGSAAIHTDVLIIGIRSCAKALASNVNGFVLTELRKCTDTQSLLAALRSGRGEEPVPCAVSVEHIRVIGLSALKAYLCNLDHALVRRLDLNLSGELQLMIGPDPLCQAASLAAEVEAVLFEGFAT